MFMEDILSLKIGDKVRIIFRYKGKTDFKIKNIMKSNLNKNSKNIMSTYSFYKIKQKFQYKIDKHYLKNKIYYVNEYNTSKMCSKCEEINDVGDKETYNC